MASKISGYNRQDLILEYPEIVEVLDQIFDREKTKYSAQRSNWEGRYTGKRRLSFAKIKEILEENNWTLNIKPVKIK